MFFKERKLDTVKPFDTTKEGNWSECLSIMCHLLWSVSHPTLISGVPVCIGAISCMIVHSCLTHHAWEKAVSFTPARADTAVRRHQNLLYFRCWALAILQGLHLYFLPAQLRENHSSVQRLSFKMNWQSSGKEDEKELKIYFKVQDFLIRILKPIEFICSLLLKVWSIDQQHWNHMVACYKCKSSDPTQDQLNQNLHFNKILKKFVCTLEFVIGWPNSTLLFTDKETESQGSSLCQTTKVYTSERLGLEH